MHAHVHASRRHLDSTLTLDLQQCNMSGMLFELEAATMLSAANADVVVLLVYIGGWCYKLYALSQVCDSLTHWCWTECAIQRANLTSRHSECILLSGVKE